MIICENFYRGKRVLVTGHTGFVGAWLYRTLLLAGARVEGYSIDISKSIPDDVCNKGHLEEVVSELKPEIIFHLAAQTDIETAILDPAKTYETNVIGTVNVLDSVKDVAGVRSIVVASSHKIYEDKEQPWAYRENDSLVGSDPLTDSKICVESIVKTYRKVYFKDYGGTSISTARFGNLFGGGDYRKGKILSDCINATRENKVIEVHQSSSVRPYMHVLDAVKGMLLLAQRQYEEKRFEGAYNFGPDYDECIHTGDLVRMFCKEWGEGCHSCLAVPMEPHYEPQILRLDTARSKSTLWWNPKMGIKDALKEYVEWEKSIDQGIKAEVITEQQIKRYFN